jgi:hypothetical protein
MLQCCNTPERFPHVNLRHVPSDLRKSARLDTAPSIAPPTGQKYIGMKMFCLVHTNYILSTVYRSKVLYTRAQASDKHATKQRVQI